MTLSTSTVTLAPGSSRTYTLAPGEAVTVATEPNCYVTVTETPDVISSADLITADPTLTAAYRPRSGSPLIGAGTHLGYVRDLDGKQRPNPPSIGAYDVANVTTRPRTLE